MPDNPARSLVLAQYSSTRDGSTLSALLLADGLRKAGWAVHVTFGFPGPMMEVFQEAGHTVEVVPHKNWLRSTRLLGWLGRILPDEWRAASRFKNVIGAREPGVVYVNSCVSLAAALGAWRAGVPCIWHLRELFSDVGGEMRVPPVMRRSVERAFAQLSDRVVVNSDAVAENMLGRADGVAVVPNAAGDAFFATGPTAEEARRQFDLPVRGSVLGVPGTLRPVKGHAFFFEAVAPLVHADPSLSIAVTGHGPSAYREQLVRQVRRLGIANQVRFLGSIDTMPSFYRACDAVCIPSVAESFGRTVIEAFASGTPVVATAVGGIRETVTDGETGMLVPFGNEAALAQALVTVLSDETKRSQLTSQARRAADELYRESAYQERLVGLVEQVFHPPSTPKII